MGYVIGCGWANVHVERFVECKVDITGTRRCNVSVVVSRFHF